MALEIKGLKDVREWLERLRVEEVMGRALAEQAERLAEAVRDGLSAPAGSGEHDQPWARTGALRDSVGVQTDGLQAAVGSNDPAAAPQEMGTSHIPPRPFLAPVAASIGENIAHAIGQRLAAAIKSVAGPDHQTPLETSPVGISTVSSGTPIVAGTPSGTRACAEF